MTENAHEGHIVNPDAGRASTSDPDRPGDAGDQGNDLRFAEEQRLITEQAEPGQEEGSYTSADVEGDSGGYTSAQDPAEEGEYTDKDTARIDEPESQGEYTDRDR
ncbi:hypothetical protein E8P82_12480 [Arthrobacter echini]|uniref:Uncharacterized protein n=1 Tax=Arthrobacter echini TaxID=1529066 RepID=A0A4S5E1B6_9MICC|nr:hypothetical protein [Arthrobacter echini]THJ65126.1 hypothetical protein E8P82_12480 [Arthrobacter echini]